MPPRYFAITLLVCFAWLRPLVVAGILIPVSVLAGIWSAGPSRRPRRYFAAPVVRRGGVANLPDFALDRLSRYEATLWHQARQILLALDALDRRKPQERVRRFRYREDVGL